MMNNNQQQYYQQNQQNDDDDELMNAVDEIKTSVEEIKVNIGTLATLEQFDKIEKALQSLSKRFEEFIMTNFANTTKNMAEMVTNTAPQKRTRGGKKQATQQPQQQTVDNQAQQTQTQMINQFNGTPNAQINQTLPIFAPSTPNSIPNNNVAIPPTEKPKTIIASTYFNLLFSKSQQQLQAALKFIDDESIKTKGNGIQDTFESIYGQWFSKDDKGKKEFIKNLYGKFDAKTKAAVKTLQKNESLMNSS